MLHQDRIGKTKTKTLRCCSSKTKTKTFYPRPRLQNPSQDQDQDLIRFRFSIEVDFAGHVLVYKRRVQFRQALLLTYLRCSTYLIKIVPFYSTTNTLININTTVGLV